MGQIGHGHAGFLGEGGESPEERPVLADKEGRFDISGDLEGFHLRWLQYRNGRIVEMGLRRWAGRYAMSLGRQRLGLLAGQTAVVLADRRALLPGLKLRHAGRRGDLADAGPTTGGIFVLA